MPGVPEVLGIFTAPAVESNSLPAAAPAFGRTHRYLPVPGSTTPSRYMAACRQSGSARIARNGRTGSGRVRGVAPPVPLRLIRVALVAADLYVQRGAGLGASHRSGRVQVRRVRRTRPRGDGADRRNAKMSASARSETTCALCGGMVPVGFRMRDKGRQLSRRAGYARTCRRSLSVGSVAGLTARFRVHGLTCSRHCARSSCTLRDVGRVLSGPGSTAGPEGPALRRPHPLAAKTANMNTNGEPRTENRERRLFIYRTCVTTSTSAGSPRLTTAMARRSAGARSFGFVIGPSA